MDTIKKSLKTIENHREITENNGIPMNPPKSIDGNYPKKSIKITEHSIKSLEHP